MYHSSVKRDMGFLPFKVKKLPGHVDYHSYTAGPIREENVYLLMLNYPSKVVKFLCTNSKTTFI